MTRIARGTFDWARQTKPSAPSLHALVTQWWRRRFRLRIAIRGSAAATGRGSGAEARQ